jgi:putative Mg2+ transporter-C (MgtC) family protein
VSRVIQGIVAGVGFLGAGSILKRGDDVHGLTTAAAVWFTAAVGTACGAGYLWVPALGTLLAWVVLFVLGRIMGDLPPPDHRNQAAPPSNPDVRPREDP